jgi:phage-related baseplate assembly protein
VLPQLPESDLRNGALPSLERPDLLRAVHAHLDERRVMGARLEVRAPRAIDVSVEVTLRVSARAEQYVFDNVRRGAERALYTYVSPYTGGPDGKGWPMGRDLHVSEIYARLQRVAGVEYVDEVRVTIPDPNAADGVQVVSPRLGLTSDAVLRSGQHKVLVQ